MTVRTKFTYTGYSAGMFTRPKAGPDGRRDDWKNTEGVEIRTLKFSPVCGDGDPNHENTKFWNASPSGEITLGTVNPEAWSQFELGKEYYLDFTPAA